LLEKRQILGICRLGCKWNCSKGEIFAFVTITKNWKKGIEYVGFYFRRFFMEELRDSELGWMRYKLPKFIGKTRIRGIWKLFWIFG
jgi:hypothetical protein